MATFDFDYGGRTLSLVPLRELTLGELFWIRENFDIPGQVELENGMGEMEPQAWRAYLSTVVRRTADVKADDPALDRVPIMPLILALNEESAAHNDALEAEKEKKGARPTGARRARSGSRASA